MYVVFALCGDLGHESNVSWYQTSVKAAKCSIVWFKQAKVSMLQTVALFQNFDISVLDSNHWQDGILQTSNTTVDQKFFTGEMFCLVLFSLL